VRRQLLAGLLVTGIAHAAAPILAHVEHHEFASTPLSKLQVLETRNGVAVVEGEQGEVVLVHLNDRIGLEAAQVDRISRGCLLLSGDGGQFSLCAEAPATPRS
jgi:hypothetical protein